MACSARAAISGSTPVVGELRRAWPGATALSPLIALSHLPRLLGVGAVTACLAWQAQVVAQGLPFQRAAVVTACFQQGQHQRYEIIQAFALRGEAEDEAIAGAGV